MTQEVFPEIQAATEALEKRITVTEAEIDQMKQSIRTKKALVRSWQKGLAAFSPRPTKKKAAKTGGAGARSSEVTEKT
jgi:prefoldin subunit 5